MSNCLSTEIKMKHFIVLILLSSLALSIMASPVLASRSSDQKMCDMYKKRLTKYNREGVMGINPMTGQTKKMSRSATRSVIQDTKENIKMFCSYKSIL
jgi:hypothetical protein